MRAETAVDEGQKADVEPIQIFASTPNDVTLVNEVQLAQEQPTSNVAGLGDEDSENEMEEVFYVQQVSWHPRMEVEQGGIAYMSVGKMMMMMMMMMMMTAKILLKSNSFL